MKAVQTPTSRNYHDYLLESLRNNPQEAAEYIAAVFEEEPDSALLQRVIADVVEALADRSDDPDRTRQCDRRLSRKISESGGSEIYEFFALMAALGFEVRIELASPTKTSQE